MVAWLLRDLRVHRASVVNILSKNIHHEDTEITEKFKLGRDPNYLAPETSCAVAESKENERH